MNSATPVRGLSQGSGHEVGVRFELGAVRLTTTYGWLELNSELKFVGDSGLDPPGEQIDGRVSRVEEPRTVRFGVKYNF